MYTSMAIKLVELEVYGLLQAPEAFNFLNDGNVLSRRWFQSYSIALDTSTLRWVQRIAIVIKHLELKLGSIPRKVLKCYVINERMIGQCLAFTGTRSCLQPVWLLLDLENIFVKTLWNLFIADTRNWSRKRDRHNSKAVLF